MIYFVDFAKRKFELWPSRGTAQADAVPCTPVRTAMPQEGWVETLWWAWRQPLHELPKNL